MRPCKRLFIDAETVTLAREIVAQGTPGPLVYMQDVYEALGSMAEVIVRLADDWDD